MEGKKEGWEGRREEIQMPSQNQRPRIKRQVYAIYMQTHPAQNLPTEPLF